MLYKWCIMEVVGIPYVIVSTISGSTQWISSWIRFLDSLSKIVGIAKQVVDLVMGILKDTGALDGNGGN